MNETALEVKQVNHHSFDPGIAIRLSDARAGERVRITALDVGNRETIQKIILMGALPGKTIEAIQSFPAFLVGLGNSQFAIDRELAEKIVVQPWRR